jgi:DNA-binding LytR/AlgR family response regulator
MNCIIVDDDAFSRTVIKQLVSRVSLDVLGEFSSAIDAYNILKNVSVDVVFLDVEMPEMSGLDLLRSLKKLPQIVLITAGRQYAVEAFEYSVTDYLVKPVDYARFLKAMDRVEFNLRREKVEVLSPTLGQDTEADNDEPESFYVKTKDDGRIVHIKLSDIIFVEALSDYMEINTEKSKYVVHGTMKSLERKLPDNVFTRIHRSYIINTSRIESIEGDDVVMPGKVIPIGVSYRPIFLKKIKTTFLN